ncbi:hypothetical protein PR202_gn00321 [Eleusine coracana subsp. coracana]|uniref:RING-type domain-containing protein n=1 Tax=Eleusine coracana subsp. coracana TaxID=191504 RepID=A0AAV5G2S2_ELECO|nr:hypothetical protein PR202_gn00216 [Eleusine coracana subsp. coracana]GJN41003.1 hypothetical protein PR202_gn00321 [Eleusine coracana subsp. coracana]
MAAVTMAAACATAAAAAVLALASSSSSCDDAATVAVEASSSPAASPECAVCLSELSVTGGVGGSSDDEPLGVRRLPGCGHGFHAECIGRWLPLRPECPLCRRPVPLEVAGARDQPGASRAIAASPAWARPARIACGFGDGRVVWTRSPYGRQ